MRTARSQSSSAYSRRPSPTPRGTRRSKTNPRARKRDEVSAPGALRRPDQRGHPRVVADLRVQRGRRPHHRLRSRGPRRGDPDDRHGGRLRPRGGGARPGAGPRRRQAFRRGVAQQVLLADGRRPERRRVVPQAHPGVGRGQPSPAEDRLPGPLPVPSVRPEGAARGDGPGHGGPRPPGEGPLLGCERLDGSPDRGGSRSRPGGGRVRADLEPAAVQPAGAGDRERGRADLPPPGRGADRVLSAGPGRADREVRRRRPPRGESARRCEAQRLHGALPRGREPGPRRAVHRACPRGEHDSGAPGPGVVSGPGWRRRRDRGCHAAGAGGRQRGSRGRRDRRGIGASARRRIRRLRGLDRRVAPRRAGPGGAACPPLAARCPHEAPR